MGNIYLQPYALQKSPEDNFLQPYALEKGLEGNVLQPDALKKGLEDNFLQPDALEKGREDNVLQPDKLEKGLEDNVLQPYILEKGLEDNFLQPYYIGKVSENFLTTNLIGKEDGDADHMEKEFSLVMLQQFLIYLFSKPCNNQIFLVVQYSNIFLRTIFQYNMYSRNKEASKLYNICTYKC